MTALAGLGPTNLPMRLCSSAALQGLHWSPALAWASPRTNEGWLLPRSALSQDQDQDACMFVTSTPTKSHPFTLATHTPTDYLGRTPCSLNSAVNTTSKPPAALRSSMGASADVTNAQTALVPVSASASTSASLFLLHRRRRL